MTTGTDSSITESSGYANFRNRGRLITREDIGNVVVSGRIRFTGSASDVFKVVLRTDGAYESNVYQEAANGIVFSVTSSSNWDSSATNNVAVNEIGRTNGASGGLVLAMNTFYDFKLVDDGTSVAAYVGDLTNALVRIQTTNRPGNRLVAYNRERISSLIHTTDVDYLDLQTIPGLNLLGSIEPGPAGLSAIDFADKIAFDSGTLVTYQRPATLNGYPLTDGGRIQIFSSSNSVLGSGPWSFRQTLTQPDSNYDTPSFGWALGVRSNAIFSGSSHTFRVGAHDGTGYIFNRSNSSGSFTLLERFAENPAQWAGYFTSFSSMRGGLIIASQGANQSHNSLGGAFFYSLTDSGVRTKIHSFMESNFDKWCIATAIASNTAAIFMESSTTNHQVRIFGVSRNAQGVPTAITTNQVLIPMLGPASSAWRESMDLSEDLLAVGRLNSSTNGFTNSGAVDIYIKGTNGLFSHNSTISPPLPVSAGRFGSTLALVGRTLLVGSPGVAKDATNAAGAIYVYSVQTNGTVTLVATNRIAANATYSNEIFGSSFFREGETVAVGTSGGLAENGISGRILMYRVVNSASVPSTGTAPVFTSTNSFSGTVGVYFTNNIRASGSTPITFTHSGMATGLILNSNGSLYGTPSIAGSTNATLTASNAFGTANQTVTFTIARGTPVISNWPAAAPITFGQALSNSVLSGGTSSVTGTFAWTTPTNRPNAGTNSQSVTFTPSATNNYVSVSTNISLVANKAAPVLTWAPSPAAGLTYPAPLSSTQLNATSSVSGSWVYNPTNGAVLNAGTNNLVGTFTPTDATNYTSGLTITNTVVVARGSNNILFGALPIKYVGDAAFSLTATASSGLSVTYTSSNTNVATVSGSTVALKSVGTTTITASQAGNSNWNAATNVTQTLTVQVRDTDGDGVTDVMEVADGTQTNNASSFNPLSKDLLAYYPFDGNGMDASGNGIHGLMSATNIAVDASAVKGSALRFTWAGAYPDPCVYGTGLHLANRSFTVSAWVKRFFGDNGGGWIIRTGGWMVGEPNPGGTTGQSFHIITDYEKIRFSFFYDDFDLFEPVTTGVWQHLAFVYDQAAAKRKIFVNGVLKAENTPAYGFTGNGNFSFGHQSVSLDEIRFYGKALSSSEVGQLFLATGSDFLPVITSTNSFSGKVGVTSNWTVTASGGTPITFRGTNAPAGLSVATNGVISGTPTTAGTNSTILTASNAYGLAMQTNNFVIAKGDQTISFSSLGTKYLDEGSLTLSATALSGLTVSYTSSNTNVATVSGSTVTLRSVGTTTITASQAGNSNWNAATNVTQTLIVQPAAGGINLQLFPVTVSGVIGIDFYPHQRNVLISVNFPNGLPKNLVKVTEDATPVPFSNLSGLTEEIKLAIVKTSVGGFVPGEVFMGNGVDGQILKIAADGSTITNPWVDLPGNGNGLFRGSLYHDETGLFGGDLLAVTTAGQVWRINAAGVPSLVASLGVHLEGLLAVPNNPSRYGPLAGKILAGAEEYRRLYAINPQGEVTTHQLSVAVEDIEIVPFGADFYGADYPDRVLKADRSAFADLVGEILVVEEGIGSSPSGMYRLYWDGAALRTEGLALRPGSLAPRQWEHVTFARYTPNVPPTGIPLLVGVFQVGSTVTIDKSPVQDADNYAGFVPNYQYRWEVTPDGGTTWLPITSADASDGDASYTLLPEQGGLLIRGIVSYFDGHGTLETVASASSPVITFVTGTILLTDLSQRYDGTGRAVNVSVSPTNASYTVTYNGATNLPVVPGNYTVVGTLTGSYVGSVTNTLVISPKVLSVSNVIATPRAYDRTTEVGVVTAGASLVGVVGDDQVSLLGITASGVLQGGPAPGYGKLVVVEGLMLDGEDSGNYELGPVVTTVDIGRRDLAVRAKNKAKAYGAALPALEWEVVDTLALLDGDTVNVELTTTATVSSAAGSYPITVGVVGVRDSQTNDVSGYYELSRTDGTLTVNQAVPAYTWPAIGSFGYGTVLGASHLNATSPVAGSWSYSPTNGTMLGAGVLQAVVGTFTPQDTNNHAGLVVTNRVTVTRAKLVIRAVSEEIELGRIPALEYEVTGLVNGEGKAQVVAGSLGTDPVFNATVPGVYRMVRGTVGVGAVSNYEVERFEEGVLRVKAGAGVAEGSVTPLAGGYDHSLLLRKDGGVAVWGVTNNGEANLPAGLTNVAGVAAGASAKFSLAWRKDGTAAGWGSNAAVINPGVLGSLSNVVGMAGGDNHGLALFKEGAVRAWGSNGSGQANVPASLVSSNAAGFVRVVAVSAAQNYSVALLANGRIQYWGASSFLSATNFSAITNAVGFAAGSDFILSLHADGSVRYTGNRGGSFANERSQVPASLTNPASVASNPAVAIAAGIAHGLAVRRDGSVVAWGDNQAPTGVPGGLTNAAAVAGGNLHSLILLRDGTVVGVGNNASNNVPGNRPGAVPQGGPDSDGDGWSNEAELRAGSHPLNAQSMPAKVVVAGAGTNATVVENGSLLVGNLRTLDRMGWEESLENLGGARLLGPDADKFEVVGQQLRLKAGVDYEGLSGLQGTTQPQLRVTMEVQGITQELVVTVQNDPADDGDSVPPVITLLGADPLRVVWQGTYTDPGAQVRDNVDADRTVYTLDVVNTAQAGTYTVTYTAMDGAGNAATPVTRRVVVGRTPEFWLSPGQEMTAALLNTYALGGANSPQERPQPPMVTVQTSGSGQPALALTVLVRIDDASLQVQAEASTDLGGWSSTGISSAPASDQAGVPEGFQRRIFTVPVSGNRQFIRLKVTR